MYDSYSMTTRRWFVDGMDSDDRPGASRKFANLCFASGKVAETDQASQSKHKLVQTMVLYIWEPHSVKRATVPKLQSEQE